MSGIIWNQLSEAILMDLRHLMVFLIQKLKKTYCSLCFKAKWYCSKPCWIY